MNWPFVIGLVLIITLMVGAVTTYAVMKPTDKESNSRLLAAIIGFSVTASIVIYGFSIYFFKNNPQYLLMFLLSISTAVLLPLSLISMAVSATAIGNLRDVVSTEPASAPTPSS